MKNYLIILSLVTTIHASDDYQPKTPQLKDSKLMTFESDYELWLKKWYLVSPNTASYGFGYHTASYGFGYHTASYDFEYKDSVRKTMLLARKNYTRAKQDPVILKEHDEITKKNNEELQSYNEALERYHTNNRVNWSFY